MKANHAINSDAWRRLTVAAAKEGSGQASVIATLHITAETVEKGSIGGHIFLGLCCIIIF
jgi:hypothetical protein